MDALTIITGLVVAAMFPQAIRDLKRGIRAMKLYTHITGAVSKDRD